MDSLTIRLAGKDYTIQPLTIGQLEELHVGVVRTADGDPEKNVREFWQQNVGLLAAALSADYPMMTAEELRKLRLGSLKDVKAQVDAILLYAGLIDDPKDAKPAAAANGAEAPKPVGEAAASAA